MHAYRVESGYHCCKQTALIEGNLTTGKGFGASIAKDWYMALIGFQKLIIV